MLAPDHTYQTPETLHVPDQTRDIIRRALENYNQRNYGEMSADELRNAIADHALLVTSALRENTSDILADVDFEE